MKKTFINPVTGKEWWITVDGLKINTCLNNGKVKEIICEANWQLKSKASSAMMEQMRKGFIYQNPDAPLGEATCHQFVGKNHNGFMPIAASITRDDFFITRIVGDFEDERLYHFDKDGNTLETVSLGAKRMTFEQALCANETILMNNHHLIECFSLNDSKMTPFANKKGSMQTMLDAKSELALWYTGEEIIVFDFKNNTEIWREKVSCQKTGQAFSSYYCMGQLSPQQTKVAYRTEAWGYVIVDLKSFKKVLIQNPDWHPFFSPDDQCFSVGGRFYSCETGEEVECPFPFSVKQGLSYLETCRTQTNGSLMAFQQDRGDSPIEIWNYQSRQLLAKIEDIFTVKHASFAFTKNNLIVHTDYGAVSVYRCTV